MKHIVFLEQYGSLGGGQQVLLEIVQAALNIGCYVTVIIPDGPCAQKLHKLGAEVLIVKMCALSQGKKNFSDICNFVIYGIYNFLKNYKTLYKADLIYVNGNRLLLIALFSQIFFRKKIIFHIHLRYSSLELKLFLFELKLKKTCGIIVPSEYIYHDMLDFNENFRDSRVKIIFNGLDHRFCSISYTNRFFNKQIRNVGIVGRISPEKGQDIVIYLASRLKNLQFHIIGDAAFSDQKYYEYLKKNAPKNVIFHGWVDDLSDKIQEIGIQICIVPSRCYESSSLVTMQLTILSCLVIVRNIGALAELQDKLKLFSFENDEHLLVLLNKILDRKLEDINNKVHESYLLCSQQFSHHIFQNKLKQLLEETLAN